MTRAVSMLLPEPWDHNETLPARRRAYDEYQSMLMEPWDGPVAIAYTDGSTFGAALDRNGLRPARYYVTRDDRFLLSSEVGTIEIEPSNILTAGCLGPGEMVEIDTTADRVIWNDELRARYAKEKPYSDWVKEEKIEVSDLDAPVQNDAARDAEVPMTVRMAKLGYHWDDVDEVVRAMAEKGGVPLASMGIDASLACLSKKNRSFFDYFYQLFAQVTNPPIDALRESLVTSSVLYIGNHGNLLEDSRTACQLIRLDGPMLTKDQFDRICAVDRVGFKAQRFSATYRREDGENALEQALENLACSVEKAVRNGVSIIVLSDRAAEGEVPIPSLLAVSSVHNHLIRVGVRTFADFVVETGDAISAHDFAALVGYSASGIYPYMAHECIADLAAKGALSVSAEEGIANYNKAVTAGNYLHHVDEWCFYGSELPFCSDLRGCWFQAGIRRSVFCWHRFPCGRLGRCRCSTRRGSALRRCRGYPQHAGTRAAAFLGLTKWRPQGGEEHLIDPQTIYLLQHACREGNYEMFKEYSDHLHQEGRAIRLRDLLDFVTDRTPVPLEEVEPATSIAKRFNTGAMSYGSISEEAHKCMAIAMNRLGGRSNSGEGGEDPKRETPLPNGDSMNSAIKQIASGRFGVTSRYLSSAIEIQIKMAQGAKPGRRRPPAW